ncbi:MAG: cytochrome c biogenesis protein CcdA [Blastocatellia bacterium]
MKKRRLLIHVGLAVAVALASALTAPAQSNEVVKARGYASVDGVRPGDKFKVAIALEVAEGYHINAHVPTESFLVATVVAFGPPAGVHVSEEKYPAPSYRKFAFSEDKEYAVHEGTVYVTADAEAEKSLQPGASLIRALVTVQSCNDSQCLAPSSIDVEIPLKVVAAGQTVGAANAEIFTRADAQPAAGAQPGGGGLVEYKGAGSTNSIAALISSRGMPIALLFIFVSGLLLNATPCVYPIIPITIGFFVNQSASQGGKPRLSRTFLMASMYVLGMAITYSLLGVIAAKSGGLFGAALQSPIVLITLAALMVGLALSMFGVYEFKLPESLNRFATSSTQSTSGVIGALVMGLTMGIVAAPCIGPFVLALLVFVGERGDAVYGFFMFFVLALGLGLPYLALGTFSGAINSLPRSGMWMVTVRKVFGLVLIGMALYFLMPLMGRFTNYVFVAFFALSALYLLFWESGRTKPRQFAWVLRAIGIGAAAIAVTMALPKRIEAEISWQPFSEQALAAAQREGKGVIIDTFADWCIPCKELDHNTFTDPHVKKESERFVTLKLDLTTADADSEAGRAKRRFGIRGVPTIIFLDPAGRERADLRLEGFENPAAFLSRMKQVEFTPGAGSETVAKNPAGEKGPAATAPGGPPPAVSLSLLNGGTLNIESLRGKVALLDFWATWCVPCKAEIPTFNQLIRDYKERGLEIIAVSLDEEGAAKVKPFLKENPMSYTQVIGDRAAASAFDVDDSKLPVAVILDRQGRVRFRHVGLTKREVFESEINQLLAE